jgi:glycosyltransferase involved in cell wall biosynthesis
VEIVTEELSVRMARRGHDVVCYNRRRKGQPTAGDYQGVRIADVPTVDKKGLAAVSASFFAALRVCFSRARVVHIHAEGPAFMCWLPRLFGKRVIVTVHGLDWQREKWQGGFGSKFIHAGEKMAVRFAHRIIVLSKNMQDYFRDTYDRATDFIPNGVCPPEILPPQLIAAELDLQKDGYILFLGRLVPEKGIHYLIEAFRQVQTDKKLVIAGGSSDTDSYVQRLHALAAEDPRITFCGFVQGQKLQELYSNAYLYTLPSDVEGMPLSLLEAMSYGNCCVVSDIAECTEVVEDKAYIVRRGSAEDLLQCLQMLCNDREAVEAMKASSAFVCDKYNWDEVTEKTLELYQ